MRLNIEGEHYAAMDTTDVNAAGTVERMPVMGGGLTDGLDVLMEFNAGDGARGARARGLAAGGAGGTVVLGGVAAGEDGAADGAANVLMGLTVDDFDVEDGAREMVYVRVESG